VGTGPGRDHGLDIHQIFADLLHEILLRYDTDSHGDLVSRESISSGGRQHCCENHRKANQTTRLADPFPSDDFSILRICNFIASIRE
jgi:hypothetical protein